MKLKGKRIQSKWKTFPSSEERNFSKRKFKQNYIVFSYFDFPD